MASEIRVNQIQSRTGVSTVSFTDSGPILAGVSTVQGSLTVEGNLNVDGVITYDDVTNIDSVGVITARSDIDLSVAAANNATSTISLRSDYGGGTFFDNAAIAFVQDNSGSSGGHIEILTTGSGSASPTERLRITDSGRVGIGTASTDRVLAVYGTGNLGTQLEIESPDTNAAGLSIEGHRRYEIQSTSPVYGAAPSSFIVYDRTAGAIRLGISSEGYVTKPNNPCFSATGSVAGTAVNASSTLTVPYTTEYFDVTSSYDHTNYKFTAPISGKYFFYASILNFPNDNTGYFSILGAVNGSASFNYGFARRNDLKLQNDVNFSIILNLSLGDTYEVQMETSSGSNFNYYLTNGHAHFFGYLVQ